jgi:hypothetical protein
MSTDSPDLMARLSAGDPAAGLPDEDAVKDRVWETVSSQMQTRTSAGRGRGGRRRHARRLAPIASAAALLTAGVAFGAGLIQLGAPAKTSEGFETAESPFGTVTPASVSVLPIATPDPQGGPPWGMRVFSTSRGVGCVQVGRLLDGHVGALGVDGAFGDDGRLHELPVRSTSELACSALDANGRIFVNISKSDEPANALGGPEQAPTREQPRPQAVCVPSIATPFEKSSVEGRICPQADERDLHYGLLGPDAKSITYSSEGTSRTIPTVGADGAYLIVSDAASGETENAFGPGANGVVPIYGPITEIQYSNGDVCHLTGQNTMETACSPALAEPVGYAPVGTVPSAAQIAEALNVTLTPAAGSEQDAHVSFTSRVPVDGVRTQYKIEWTQPPGSSSLSGETADSNSIAPGQQATLQTGPLPAGTSEVRVSLQYATGPELLEGPGTVEIPVGRATVTVP